MTQEKFRFIIDTKTVFEFNFNNKNYRISFSADSDGKEYIYFGQQFEEKKYYSYGQLMNEAKIENKFLKNIIETL